MPSAQHPLKRLLSVGVSDGEIFRCFRVRFGAFAAPFTALFAVFGRTHACVPMFKSCLRTIQILDSANSVIRLAVFLASPLYLNLT